MGDYGMRDKRGTILGGSKIQYTKETKNFRQAISAICELCAADAPSEKAKGNLATACAKMKVFEAAEQDAGDITGFVTILVGAFVAGCAAFALIRFRRGALIVAEEPFL